MYNNDNDMMLYSHRENSPGFWPEACKIPCKGLVVFFLFLDRAREAAPGAPGGKNRRVNLASTSREPCVNLAQ